MKNRIIISLIFILTVALVPALFVNAQPDDLLRIIALRISPSDTTATIYWTANYPATGYIQFGLTNGFGSWVEDTNLAVYHETSLGGLTPEKKYYFRLEATTSDGRKVSSDIYSFETLDEDDNKAPIVSNIHTSFVTGNTATFVWETNESSNSCVHYGKTPNDLNKKRCLSTRVKIHDLTVTDLQRNTLYYYQVSSKDRANNAQYSVTYNFQTNFTNDEDVPALQIYEISPFNRKAAENTNEVTITFRTNRPVEGYLNYGEKSGKYNKKIYLTAPRRTSSELTLTDLKADKTYYYRLYLKDVLNKKLNTPEFSFTTLPETVLNILPTEDIFNLVDSQQDFDHDGLTNQEEQEYGTDPIKADTDGDGYIDGVEVNHGYNPLGHGRLGEVPGSFAYGKSRLSSLAAEKNLALDLRQKLGQYFDSKIPQSTQHWYTLVNAYIYGDYPIEAIAKAIKHSGKTVHPTIPWSAWQNSDDYQNYINQ